MDDVGAASALVQIIYVLGYNSYIVFLLKFGYCLVGRVGLCVFQFFAPLVVEFKYKCPVFVLSVN